MPDDLNLRLATLSALLELNEAVSEDDLKAAQDCRAVSRQTTRLPEASLRFALSSLVEQKKGRLLERRQPRDRDVHFGWRRRLSAWRLRLTAGRL
jgi:hypothetical protein